MSDFHIIFLFLDKEQLKNNSGGNENERLFCNVE